MKINRSGLGSRVVWAACLGGDKRIINSAGNCPLSLAGPQLAIGGKRSVNASTNGATVEQSASTLRLSNADLLTVSAWVYCTGTGDQRYTVFGSENTGSCVSFEVGNGVSASAALALIYPGAYRYISTNGVAMNAWQHVVVVSTPTAYFAYCNGVALGNSLEVLSAGFANSATIHAAGRRSSGSQVFAGYLRDVLVFNVGLSAQQVASLYRFPQQIYAPRRRPVFASSGGVAAGPLTQSLVRSFARTRAASY